MILPSKQKSSGGGHTILNGSGSAMTQRAKLQFVGADVTDDPTNDKTIVKTTPQSMISDAWVTSHAYAVGDYCIDGNVLYKCKTAHTSSASNRPPYASYWNAVSVTSVFRPMTLLKTQTYAKASQTNYYMYTSENVDIDISDYRAILVESSIYTIGTVDETVKATTICLVNTSSTKKIVEAGYTGYAVTSSGSTTPRISKWWWGRAIMQSGKIIQVMTAIDNINSSPTFDVNTRIYGIK